MIWIHRAPSWCVFPLPAPEFLCRAQRFTITKRLPGSKTQLLAVRVTNFDGLTDPVAIETPPMAESRSYQNTSVPYAVIDIRAEHLGFDRVIVQNAQVFPDTETRQELSLIPTPELPSSFDRTETFVVPPQNLS